MNVEIKTQIEITIGNQKISLTWFEAKQLLKALKEELEEP
jgi:hypothetical protein